MNTNKNRKYIAFNVVNGIKFYFSITETWQEHRIGLKTFDSSEIGIFFNKSDKKYELKTNKHQLLVEELDFTKYLIEALKHTLEILDMIEGNHDLIETISNAQSNYFNLIQEATTI